MKPDWLARLLQGIGAIWRTIFPCASKPPPIGGTDISDAPPPEPEPTPPTDEPPSEPEKREDPRQPRRIGARRDGAAVPGEHPQTAPAPRPELICRRIARKWEVFLSTSDDNPLKEVRQDEKILPLTNDGECHITALQGHLLARCQDGTEHGIPLFEESRLFAFKLRKNWQGDGRRVIRIASGHYIIIAPTNRQRLGNPPVAPEPCAGSDFQAHYFEFPLPAGEKDGFTFACKKQEISPSDNAFELRGDVVFDDSDEGNLFVGHIPQLIPSPEIVWARAGEERKGGWKGKNFQPHKESLADTLGERQGRFFLRVYDREIRLVDSIAFRYLRDLKEIRVDGKPYTQDTMLIPPKDGSPPDTEVQFINQDGNPMHSRPTGAPILANKSGVLQIPFKPEADCIECQLGSPTGGVTILLQLPRIWWRLESDPAASPSWQGTPRSMSQQEFRQRARSGASIALRLKGVRKISVFFEDDSIRDCFRTNEEPHFSLPLRGLDDIKQIEKPLTREAHLRIGWEGGKLPIPLIRITPDPTAPADPVALDDTPKPAGDDDTDTFHPAEEPPLPCKKVGNKWKTTKRFSEGEIQAAGLTPKEAKLLHLPVDIRRTSAHDKNINKLRRWANAR